MPLVFDPLGTPSVTFFRDGEAVIELVGSGEVAMGATEIPAIAGTVIVTPSTSSGDDAFILSDGFAVGETVIVYPGTGGYTSFRVFPPSGQAFTGGSSNLSGTFVGRSFRKLTDTLWGAL